MKGSNHLLKSRNEKRWQIGGVDAKTLYYPTPSKKGYGDCNFVVTKSGNAEPDIADSRNSLCHRK